MSTLQCKPWMNKGCHRIAHLTASATYVENGKNAETIFNGGASLYINGSETPSILSGNKKGYIKIDVSDAVNTIDKAELMLNVTSEGNQKINVYGVDTNGETSLHNWNEATINWYNAVGNDRHAFEVDKTYMYGGTPIATLNINGAGKYTVDITNYAKAMNEAGNDYATIVITADTKIINYTFDDMTDFVYETDFMTGGNQNKNNIYLSSDKNYPEGTSGKSLVQKTAKGSSRIKFYNAIIPGSKGENAFTQADLGRKFKVTGYVYAEDEDATFSVLLMGDIDTTNAQNSQQKHSVTAKANTWTSLGDDIIFEVTQKVIDGQYTLLSFERSATGADVVYIDNLVVWELEKADMEIESLDSTYKEVLGYSNSFDDSTIENGGTTTAEYSSTDVFRSGGSASGGSRAYSGDCDHTYGDTTKSGSMHITYSREYADMSSKGLIRFKLYNTVENDRSLTSADVGRKFRVKFWAKGSVDGIKMKVGHMSISGTSFVGSKIMTTTSQWAQYIYEFEITEKMATADATKQGTMLTFERSATNFVDAIAHKVGSVYIDDVEVYEIVEQQNTNPPCVVYTTGEEVLSVNAVADSFVQSGDSMFENAGYNAKIAVGNNAQVAQTLAGVKNTYLKFASDNFANANKAELKFTVKDNATQKVNIYGIANASWTQNELNWNNSPSVLDATLVSTVDIADKGEYTVDVLDFVTENTGGDITFILEALTKDGMKVVNFNFDTAINFVKDADYILSDANAIENISITNAEYYEGNGSLHIVDVKKSAENIKILNIFKNSNFTSDDIGRKYKISGMIKASTTGRTYANGIYTNYDLVESTNVRMGIASLSSDDITTGTGAEFTVLAGQWQPFSFDVTISETFVNAKGNSLLIDQINAPNGVFATSLYIDNLIVQETSEGFGTKVIIDNTENAPTLYTEIASEIEYADMSSSSILQKTPVSSGNFKEGDTIELRTTVIVPVEKVVSEVTFKNGEDEIYGKVYKDGYDYVLRMYDVGIGEYSITTEVVFEDGTSEVTSAKTFSITSGKSYEVVSTVYEGNITPSSTLTITKTVKNNTDTPKTAILVLAVYDKSDNLISSSYSKATVTLEIGKTNNVTATVTMPQTGEYTVKAFIWDSMQSAMPLVASHIISASDIS
ncbi:MAG: DNRLRE domain-containing protein [Ruminococcaceae bacterium]|nr:DNRLRE domain-containing protein [Oscillospiraceae bacterium]